MIVYVQTPVFQFTLVFVEPVTVAVSVLDWPRMRTVPTEDVTETVMTFAELLPPQPLKESRPGTTSTSPRKVRIPRDFVPTITPTKMRPADQPSALTLLSSEKLRSSSLRAMHAATVGQNVRLTVNRNVVFGSK
jgi:hypothetical protein